MKMKEYRFKTCEKYGYVIEAENYEKAKEQFNKIVKKEFKIK